MQKQIPWSGLVEKTMKILVVDDDELIRELLVEILAAHDYADITQAESGEDALEKIQSTAQPFDCFMFDIQMPGMDGIELCGHVRAMSHYRDTPVVMITAMNNQDYIGRAFSCGATDYVTKPFDSTELITRIRLADRLQEETKRANQAVVASHSQQKSPYAKPQPINEIRGFVNSAILENYVTINQEQNHFPLAAMAVHIPELSVVHSGSSEEEFMYVLTDIAEVISDLMCGCQACMSYLGGGVYICVGNRNKMPDSEEVRSELNAMLNDPDLVYCDEVSTNFSPKVGQKASPKLLERRGDMRFLDRAIDNMNETVVAMKTSGIGKFAGRFGIASAA